MGERCAFLRGWTRWCGLKLDYLSIYPQGPHHRRVGHDLDLGDGLADDAEGEHRSGPSAGSPHRSGGTVDEGQLRRRGPS
jgi:hypothetical protein